MIGSGGDIAFSVVAKPGAELHKVAAPAAGHIAGQKSAITLAYNLSTNHLAGRSTDPNFPNRRRDSRNVAR